ncbi:DUF2730 domain-containing protein [Shewanella eurypsychrophilus]|uniref:DUF2730 domain-containing protein n=1 Tax=Shewanella eurypsychrophilus TaxID=2593656 RepID=A0ABX6VBP2_9GAMM|nr:MULTISPECIES: DUF2730 family protein [Shewanella]QPG58969.2 DUF2730 domain-containing protein [Shewanella eurypsychrophilus]
MNVIEWFKTYWVQIYAFISLAFLCANWFLAKTYAKQDNINKLEKRVDQLESDIEHLPSKDEFHRLDKNLVEVNAQLKAVSPQLKSLQRMTEMLTENELREKN